MKVICILNILLNCLALGLTASVQPDIRVDVQLEIATDVVSDTTSETDTTSEPTPTTSEPDSTSEPTPTTDTVNNACTDGEYRSHSDCTNFLQCANGVLVEQNCSSGLHWSVNDSRCQSPNIAGCTASDEPSETCTNGEYLRHPDCTKFQQCANGVLVVHVCSGGLHWNVATTTCDWPNSAQCIPETR